MRDDQKALAALVTIRDAKESDVAAIAGIYAHHVLHGLGSFEETPPSTDEMTARFRAIQLQGLPYLAAEADGRILGYAYAGLYRTRSAYRYTLEDSLYLDPDFTKLGIGKQLLASLVSRAEDKGFRRMIAVIGDSGHRPSIRLHESIDFSHAGLLPSAGFKAGRWVNCVLMQRPLGPGDTTLPEKAP